jgi:hypothetical protein
VLPSARRFAEHGAVSEDREIPQLEPVTLAARAVHTTELEAERDPTSEQLTLRRLRAAE